MERPEPQCSGVGNKGSLSGDTGGSFHRGAAATRLVSVRVTCTFLGPVPPSWSGIVPGATHPVNFPLPLLLQNHRL